MYSYHWHKRIKRNFVLNNLEKHIEPWKGYSISASNQKDWIYKYFFSFLTNLAMTNIYLMNMGLAIDQITLIVVIDNTRVHEIYVCKSKDKQSNTDFTVWAILSCMANDFTVWAIKKVGDHLMHVVNSVSDVKQRHEDPRFTCILNDTFIATNWKMI